MNKYKKIGMVLAMKEEAQPIIEGLKLEQVKSIRGAYKVFTAKNVVLVLAGIGIVNATMATQYLITEQNCDFILNFGTCGATGKLFNACDIVSVKRVFKRDVDLTIAGYNKYEIPGNGIEIDLEADENFKSCDCYSSDEFVGVNSIVSTDVIVEMEAYPVAFVCKKYEIPCKIYKVVSDFTETNETNSEHIKNLEKASKTMAEYIIKLVKQLI